MKATIAVLGFILSSAAKHNVDSESLSSELQQLGLPKGNGEGEHPWGVTKGRTWWDVSGLSWQPPALPPSRPDPVRDGSHTVLRHLPSAPSVPWGLRRVLRQGLAAAGLGSAGGFLVFSLPALGRARWRVVPVLRGEAELPPGQPQGLQPET